MITSEDLEWLCEAKGVTEKVIFTILIPEKNF
jgi:hypothetical protein